MSVTSEDTATLASLPHTLCLFIECPLNQEGISHPEGVYMESKERLFSEKEPFPSPLIVETLLFVEDAFHRACSALHSLNSGDDVEMNEIVYMDSVSVVERYRYYHTLPQIPTPQSKKSRRISWPSSFSEAQPRTSTLLQITDEKLRTIYAIQEQVRREVRDRVGIDVKNETMKDRLNRLEKEVSELTRLLESMKQENASLAAQVQKSRTNYFNLLNARRHGLQIEGGQSQTKTVPGGIVAARIAAVEKQIHDTQKLKAKLTEAACSQLLLENGEPARPQTSSNAMFHANGEASGSNSGRETRITSHATQTAQEVLLGKNLEQSITKDSSSSVRCKSNRRWSRRFVSWLPMSVVTMLGRGL